MYFGTFYIYYDMEETADRCKLKIQRERERKEIFCVKALKHKTYQ